MDKENKLILYKDEEGRVSVNTRFADEDVWLTQAQLVEIYQSSKSNISEHLTNIFADKELEQGAVVRKFRTTAADGKNYQVLHYNLDVIIALGYRVQSPIAVRFRRWATLQLHEYIQKGFTMDDERLKQGGSRYFKELLQLHRRRTGKTADDYPSLYIWGRKTTSQPLGLYRSDDQGITWTRINDDQNQFGGPGNAQIVCGDMNVYGRVYMSTVGRGVICGTFFSDEDTNINTLSAPQTSSLFREGIYDLQGRRYAERPSVQGLYIRNGKKILIE